MFEKFNKTNYGIVFRVIIINSAVNYKVIGLQALCALPDFNNSNNRASEPKVNSRREKHDHLLLKIYN